MGSVLSTVLRNVTINRKLFYSWEEDLSGKEPWKDPWYMFWLCLLLGREPKRLVKSWETVEESYLILQNIVRVNAKPLRDTRGQGSPKATYRNSWKAAQQGLGTAPGILYILAGCRNG